MDDTCLFDDLDLPPMITPNDSARTGRNMPISSHRAADRSQPGLPVLRRRVLVLVRENDLITGAELNELYRETYKRREWDRASYDGPRKRAGEMANPEHMYGGLLKNVAAPDEDARYIVTEAGLAVIA